MSRSLTFTGYIDPLEHEISDFKKGHVVQKIG